MCSIATIAFTKFRPQGNLLPLLLSLKFTSPLVSAFFPSPTGHFNTAATPTSVNPNPPILNVDKKKGFEFNNLEDALISFNQMLKSRNTKYSIYHITKVLGAIAKMGHFETVLSLITKIETQGFLVNDCTIGIGINCYCHLNRVDFGFSLLGSLLKRGYLSNVVYIRLFGTLINGLVLDDKVYEAVELFKRLVREKQILPNVITYGTVINGLCKSGNTKFAIELLKSLGKIHNFKADLMVHCYSMIIDGLCKDRMVSDAMSLFAEMTEKGISPDVVTYSSLIQGLCNFGQWKEANRLFCEMAEHKVSPSGRTFSILVDAICKEGMVRKAEDLLEVMIQRGEVPDIVTYNFLMDEFCLLGQMEEAKEFFNSMVNRCCA